MELENSSITDLILIQNKLPRGHYDIKKAKQLIDDEYALCRAVEKQLRIKYPELANYRLGIDGAFKVCIRICDFLGVRRLSKIVFNPSLVTAANCGHRTMTVRYTVNSMDLILHELAHHICQSERKMGKGHDQGFCDTQVMLWETADFLYGLDNDNKVQKAA